MDLHPLEVVMRCATSRSAGGARNAFSIIELLVVIVIVTVLIAMIMPSFKKARDTAKVIQCRNNLHQLGLASAVYAADFMQVIPTNFQAAVSSNPLFGYLATPNLARTGCPGKGGQGYDTSAYWSYTINDNYRFDTAGWPYWGPIRLDKVKKPAHSILGLDCSTQTNYSPTHFEERTLAEGRHNGEGLNFVFPDGHTEYLMGKSKAAGGMFPSAEWRTRFPSHSIPQTVTGPPYCTFYGGCFWHPI